MFPWMFERDAEGNKIRPWAPEVMSEVEVLI